MKVYDRHLRNKREETSIYRRKNFNDIFPVSLRTQYESPQGLCCHCTFNCNHRSRSLLSTKIKGHLNK